MKSLLQIATIFLLNLCVNFLIGQGNYVPPKIPGKYEEELKEAVLLAQGGQVEQSVHIITDIIRRYPDWADARRELARIYYKVEQKQAAIEQLEAIVVLDTVSYLQDLFTIGRIYEEVTQPERALACYDGVIRSGADQQELVGKATASKIALEKKKDLWKSEDTIQFSSFDSDINTPNHESLGRWTLDGQTMIFTRLLGEQEDIFFATFDTTAALWRIEDFPYNSPQNEGAQAISPDGKYLIFTSCRRQDSYGDCDLYLSYKQRGQWTKPVNMGPVFNGPSWDGQPCFGLDGLSLFYSSGRPGGMGGRDIWYVFQIAAGKWSAPVNAGPEINTADDEESPFVHFDGQTLYFMRNGKQGLGGYDLYISHRAINGKWETAVNLGAPINTGADEGALTLHPDGTRAIITRMTENAKNDLFEFNLPEKFKSIPQQALRVTIKDIVSGQPVRARLEVFEVSDFDTIRTSQWTDEDGLISVALRSRTSYGVMAVADEYLMYSVNLDPDTSALRLLDIKLTPLASAADKVIVLQNVFFETGSAALLPTSEPELNKLLWTLRKNTGMKMEIRGHTDHAGDEQINQKLSEARAKAVYDYLTGRGIEASRLTYAGFGETQPIADNATEEGRKQNRRTEFKIITN